MFLRELAAEKAKKQPKQIDYITQDAPIFDTMDFNPSSHGLQHAYEKLTSITGGKLVGVDGELPEANMETTLDWQNLGILGFKLTAGQDKVKIISGGSFPAYVARKSPSIMAKTAMDSEASLIYDLLKPFAQKNSRVIDANPNASGITGFYSIIAVRWEDEELCGLYDPNGFGQGAMFETTFLSGGQPYDLNGKIVYGASFKSYLGFLLANPDNIGMIANLDVSHKPTAAMVDDMLDNCKAGTGGKTFIYGHPKALRMINDLKESRLVMGPDDTHYSRRIGDWDGIDLVGSYNFKKGTEAALYVG